MNRQTLGAAGETYVARHLAAEGLVIVDRNVRTPYGEIDLVAQDGDAWVFVEVKTRRGVSRGTPEEAITPAKRQRMARSAQQYLADRAREDDEWRLDVVAVVLDATGVVRSVNRYEGIGLED